MIFDPDDFRGRPYTAGLNQMGHVVFGAALVVLFGYVGAVAAFLAWETYQYKYRNGRFSDCVQDTVFWGIGVWMQGSEYMPVVAVICGAVWMGYTWHKTR